MVHSKFRIVIVLIVFISVISFPIINDRLKLIKDIVSSENRKMASKPEFDVNLLDPYPDKYEKYYNDNFTIRSILVKYYNLVNLKVFKKSPIPDQVIIGNDGWLFLAGNENDSYRGKHRFKESELRAFKLELEYRKKYLNDRGCKFYFLIAPVKANIYSNKIPNNIFRINKQSWGEQLIEYLNKTSEVKPINVYDILRAHKKNELLYFKLDNHWNQLGAFYVSNEILKRIHIDLPEVTTTSLSDYEIIKTETNNNNIANMLSNLDNFKDITLQLSPKSGFHAKNVPPAGYPVVKGFPYPWDYENDKEITGSKKPNILIISDSFGNNLFPFLAEEFSRSVKIFDSWQYKLNEDIVKSEKPDVVLLVVLESNVRNMLSFQSRLNNK
jgi:alginate O-acetyltransferase complex protein AlgJ